MSWAFIYSDTDRTTLSGYDVDKMKKNVDGSVTLHGRNLKNGPVVLESAPNTLGAVNNFWFHYVTDIGNAGPDKGKGGKYLFLPPDYRGEVPEGYFVCQSSTDGNYLFTRGYVVDGTTTAAVENLKKNMLIYPLAQVGNPPPTNFVNTSGKV